MESGGAGKAALGGCGFLSFNVTWVWENFTRITWQKISIEGTFCHIHIYQPRVQEAQVDPIYAVQKANYCSFYCFCLDRVAIQTIFTKI